jgi:hypothetical protein
MSGSPSFPEREEVFVGGKRSYAGGHRHPLPARFSTPERWRGPLPSVLTLQRFQTMPLWSRIF